MTNNFTINHEGRQIKNTTAKSQRLEISKYIKKAPFGAFKLWFLCDSI